MTNPRVLIVDDEKNIRDLLEAGLKFVGFSVYSVANGTEAVAVAEKANPDIIVLDVMLPDQSGFSVTKKLRSMGIDVPVLFLSARDDRADKVTGLTVGGDDYMTKPFSIDEVIARINAILRRTKSSRLKTAFLKLEKSKSTRTRMKSPSMELRLNCLLPNTNYLDS